MAELYLFSQDDEFLTILSEDEGLVDTWFKDYENHVEDESFVFNVESNSPLLEHIVEENQAAFYDRDGRLRLVRMKDLREVTTSDGGMISHQIRVICEPSFLELHDHFIEDRRIADGTAQTALNRALDGSRYVGEVTVDLGLATDNFYWIDGIEAVYKILKTWGGALKDTITLNEDNEVIERKLWIVQRLGTDNGLIVEPDYNAEEISRNTLSYPETALWGQGASLEIEDDEGEHTGGYTRYLTFEDVEWKVSNGDPVDKPKGQKWVGDPDALKSDGDGYKHSDGTRKHRFGHFSNQDYEDPEELLWATWQELQERKLKEVMHEATIYETDKKVSLGDTVTVLDRNYNKPIELQSQITGLEYDIFYPDDEIKIVVGKYVDMNEDPLQKEVDDLKEDIRKPRPTKPIDNGSFPDIKPGTPVNVEAHGSFQQIHLFWDYDSKVYISHYEVYGSQISDFVPDEQHLLYRGRVSAFIHEVATDEKWYYYVRAVNTRGTEGEFSNRVDASSVRVINDDILFGEITADKLAENLDLANKLSEGTLDWINEEPLYEIRESENRILSDVGNRIGDILNDIDLIEDDLGDLRYQDVEINNRIDGLSTIVQNTTGEINDLTDEVEHQSTQISKWEQRADGFEQSVVDVRGDLNNAVSDISLIEQEANKISLSVSELETDFNNLEIGGRNYIGNSKPYDDRGWNFTQSNNNKEKEPVEGYLIIENDGDSWKQWQIYDDDSMGLRELEPDTLYTLSFEVKSLEGNVTGTVKTDLRYQVDSGWVYEMTASAPSSDITGEWKRFYTTETISAESIENYSRIRIIPYFSGIGRIAFRNFKLETGTKATDWSPAPEDMADRANLISYINLSTEGVRIHGEKVHISGQTIIDDGIIGTAAIANLAVDRFHLKYGIIDNVHIADATIEHGKMKSLNVDHVVAGQMSLNYLKAGTIDTDKFLVRGGSSIDYAMIDGSFMELRGRYNRTWRNSTTTHDVRTKLQNGHLRFRNDNLGRSLYMSEFGISTYVDGEGELGGSSGSVIWWDTEHSPSSQKGITVNSYGGTAALVSDQHHALVKSRYNATMQSTESNIDIHTHSDITQRRFRFTKSTDRLQGYLLFGDNDFKGLRFDNSSNGIVQVVDSNNQTGGDTEIEAGLGRFNMVVRRQGSNYVDITTANHLRVGTSSDGSRRIEARPVYARTYSSAANVHITPEFTLGRSTSASKYKNAIESQFKNRQQQLEHSRQVLNLDISSWYDKAECDTLSREIEEGKRLDEDNFKLQRHVGLIAEHVRDIGLNEHVTYGSDGDLEGIEYDRLWIHTLPVLNDHEDRINILELENQYLKQKIKQLESAA